MFLKKTVLYITYLFILFFIAEFCLRIFFPIGSLFFISDNKEYICPSKDPKLVYELVPNTPNTNCFGLWDIEYPVQKPKDTVRIVLLGDSIAQGIYFNRDENYATYLENKLNASGSSKKYEVINLGVIGYDTLKIFEMFKKKGLMYNADIVIYGYWFNDPLVYQAAELGKVYQLFKNLRAKYIKNLCESKIGFCMEKILDLELIKRMILLCDRTTGNGCLDFVYNNFENGYDFNDNLKNDLWVAYERAFKERFEKREDAIDIHTMGSVYNRPASPDEFNFFLDLVMQMKQLTNKHNSDFYILMTPTFEHFVNDPAKGMYSFVDKMCADFDIGLINTVPEFSKYSVQDFKVKDDDYTHFNTKGHHLVADFIYNYLIENEIIEI